jgi:hypothetical protein
MRGVAAAAHPRCRRAAVAGQPPSMHRTPRRVRPRLLQTQPPFAAHRPRVCRHNEPPPPTHTHTKAAPGEVKGFNLFSRSRSPSAPAAALATLYSSSAAGGAKPAWTGRVAGGGSCARVLGVCACGSVCAGRLGRMRPCPLRQVPQKCMCLRAVQRGTHRRTRTHARAHTDTPARPRPAAPPRSA